MALRASTTEAAPVAQVFPLISAADERVGETYSLDTTGLTGVGGYQWASDGVDVSGATSATFVTTLVGGTHVTCSGTSDQGDWTTPAMYCHDNSMMNNNTVVQLLPHDECDIVSVRSGAWDSASTWNTATVPAAGANVLIANGHTVTYDVTTAVRLDRLRVDGHLQFDRSANWDILVETCIVNIGGHLDMGTSFVDNCEGDCTWTISDRCYTTSSVAATDIDTTRDPTLLGRGIIPIGKWTSFGVSKTPFVKTADDSAPMSTDTSLTLASTPTNWEIGDTIVIPGTITTTDGNGDPVLQDESRTVTAISGTSVSWSGGLSNDHDHHNASITRTDLQPPIANVTRNILILSEETADADEANVWRRGHTMYMHGDVEIDLWDIEFRNMGRTDKANDNGVQDGSDFVFVERDDGTPGTGADNMATDTGGFDAQSNIQSRYPVHFHFAGFGGSNERRVQNCYVNGTPGWGMVHHGCEAKLNKNLITGYYGAGMVSETSDEVGEWLDNLIWGTTWFSVADGGPEHDLMTSNPKLPLDINGGRLGDFGKNGEAYFFRGRAMRTNRNIAMSTGMGYAFFHREYPGGVGVKRNHQNTDIDLKDLTIPGTFGYNTTESRDYPIIHFEDNEAIGTIGALGVVKADPLPSHGLSVNIRTLKAWAVQYGATIDYVANYVLEDFDLVARDTGAQYGFWVSGVEYYVTITGGTVSEFSEGVHTQLIQLSPVDYDDFNATTNPAILVNGLTFDNCSTNVGHDNGLMNAVNQGADVTRTEASELTPGSLSMSLAFETCHVNGSLTVSNQQTGTITDTLGTRNIPAEDDYNIYPNPYDTDDYIGDVGYWTYGGNNIALYAVYYSDRTTGEFKKEHRAFRYTGSVTGYTNNGAFTLASTPVTRADISDTCDVDGTVNISVVAGATVESGATAYLDTSYFAPQNGTMTFNVDGDSVDYSPDEGFSGTDVFYVFVGDGRGYFATVKVTVTVS